MLEELKRPSVEVFVRDAESIKQKILSKYACAKELINCATIDDEAFNDLLSCLNFSLDSQDNQIFFDADNKTVLVYDIVNAEFIHEEEDLIAIIEA